MSLHINNSGGKFCTVFVLYNELSQSNINCGNLPAGREFLGFIFSSKQTSREQRLIRSNFTCLTDFFPCFHLSTRLQVPSCCCCCCCCLLSLVLACPTQSWPGRPPLVQPAAVLALSLPAWHWYCARSVRYCSSRPRILNLLSSHQYSYIRSPTWKI